MAVPGIETLESIHSSCERFLKEHIPELLATARALDPGFRLVPFSGLGQPPSRGDVLDERLSIRPCDVHPVWPAAPLVVALAEAEPELLPEFVRP